MSDTSPAALFLDRPRSADEKLERLRRFQTVEVPRLRVIGFALNAAGVILHNWLVMGRFSWTESALVTAVLVGYALLAWAALVTFWDRVRVVDLGDIFLVLDLFFLAFVVYMTGAERSLIWLVFLARPSDQVATTFKRSLIFAHLGPLTYFLLILFVDRVEHHQVLWAHEWAKILFLYMMSGYIALTARTAEARRKKLSTARRVAEDAMRGADDRRHELEHALGRLEAASKAKSEFLANVSHELRTPLNSVLGSSELLIDTPLTREQRELVGVLRDSATSLSSIVSDILDLARVEARRLPLEQIPMRLRDVVGSTLRMFTARTRQRPIELVCQIDRDVPDALTGDPVRLRQVLTNLIGNAVKFTEEGEIAVRVSRDEAAHGRVALRFAVADTGIGIPKERQAAIFEAFTQADGSNTRKYGGTGLGLTIAHQLVQLMDGRLWVDSDVGRGSTFSFVAWFGLGADQTVDAPWGRRRVAALVVDRAASSRAAVEEALAFWGAEVRDAAGGHAALAAADRMLEAGGQIDIAFIDAGIMVSAPGGAGVGISAFELAARLRGAPYRVPRVVLMLGSRDSAGSADRTAAANALYLVKPVTSHVLAELVRGAFAAEPAQSPALLAHAQPVRPLRILVVDDHEVNHAVVAAVLKKWGHAVSAVLNGQEALDKLAAERYDVVLMDIQMPVMDGLDATRRLREREQVTGAARTPVIAMTARALDEDRARCVAAGMDGYLTKPLDQRALFEQLQQFGGAGVAAAPRADAATLAPMISDPGLVRHIAELFLSTAPAQIARLSAAIEQGDTAQARAIAHSLRGSAGYFAGADIGAAADIEDMCEAGELERAETRLAALRADMETLFGRLREFLGQ